MQTIYKKLIFTAFILIASNSVAYAASIFNITPSIISNTISTNGMGVVKYTVVNNTNKTLSKITIQPNYEGGGALSSLSLQNDNCSGSTLLSNASCTFQLSVSGVNQPSTVTLSPKVCAFNGAICSVPIAELRTQVTVVTPTSSTPSAYLTLYNLGKLQSVLTSSNTLGTSASGFSFASASTVAVSPNGSNVYIGTANSANLFIYNVTSGNTTTVPLTLSLERSKFKTHSYLAPSTPHFVAASPDGTKVYITDGSNGIWVYNTATGKIVTNINNSTYLASPTSLVVSPDSAYLYVINRPGPGISKKASFTTPPTSGIVVINTSTYAITQTLQVNIPQGIAISPDGSQLYVTLSTTLRSSFSPGATDFSILNPSTLSTISTISLSGLAPSNIAISPNGNTAYVTDSAGDISIINLLTQAHTEVSTAFTPYGIAITPDGSNVYFTSTDTTNIGILNTSSGQISYLNVGDEQGTAGHFVG